MFQTLCHCSGLTFAIGIVAGVLALALGASVLALAYAARARSSIDHDIAVIGDVVLPCHHVAPSDGGGRCPSQWPPPSSLVHFSKEDRQ